MIPDSERVVRALALRAALGAVEAAGDVDLAVHDGERAGAVLAGGLVGLEAGVDAADAVTEVHLRGRSRRHEGRGEGERAEAEGDDDGTQELVHGKVPCVTRSISMEEGIILTLMFIFVNAL